MKRKITISILAVTFVLMFTAGGFTNTKLVPKTADAAVTAQKPAPVERPAPIQVTITDKSGRPSTLDSLSPEDRAKVERLRSTMEKFRAESGAGGAQRIKIHIGIDCCPLHGSITIDF